eukprot:4140671-Prymnesium_polylepis.1
MSTAMRPDEKSVPSMETETSVPADAAAVKDTSSEGNATSVVVAKPFACAGPVVGGSSPRMLPLSVQKSSLEKADQPAKRSTLNRNESVRVAVASPQQLPIGCPKQKGRYANARYGDCPPASDLGTLIVQPSCAVKLYWPLEQAAGSQLEPPPNVPPPAQTNFAPAPKP